MNFSEFANMIYDFNAEKLTHSKYVLFLIDQIMEEPFTEEDKQKAYDGKYNPLDKLAPNTLEKYFNGSKNISKEHARIIRAHLDKDKFENYIITKFNNKAMDYFSKTLKEAGISIIDNQVSLACADTFENILEDILKDNPKDSSKDSTKDSITLKVKKDVPPKDDRPFEEIFNASVISYNVEGFLESDPTESLSPHFFDDMKTFVRIIQQSNEDKNTIHKDEKTSCKMYEFSETLLKYVTYSEEQMNLVYTKTGNNKSDIYSRKTYLAKYEPPNDNKDFGNRTINYRNSLKSLYDEIESLYKEEQPPKKLYPVIF